VVRFVKRYTRWLHTRWPAGTVEKLPVSGEDGVTTAPGVRIVGDLTGIPLLKFSSYTGAQAVRAILREPEFRQPRPEGGDVLDLAIVGGGVAGVSAAIEARKAGLRYAVFEATEPFSTLINFPRAKPIYTYPTEMQLDGGLQFAADVKEDLVEEVEAQAEQAGVRITPAYIERIEPSDGVLTLHRTEGPAVRARRVIVAIGRSGNFRKLGCPGEDLDKVYNRLFDPKDYSGLEVLVVGGGDTALETAIALAAVGAKVTLSYRKKEFSRPKPENLDEVNRLVAAGAVKLMLGTVVTRIEPNSVTLRNGKDQELPNDVVFTMLGREAPLDFFRRSGIAIRGEWHARTWATFLTFFAFCWFLYLWKAGSELNQVFQRNHWFPYNIPATLAALTSNPKHLLGVLAIDLGQPGFYYSLAYTLLVAIFGWKRIRRRRTQYVRLQTWCLIAFQAIPLFLLPYLVLPWMGYNGWFDSGSWKYVADQLFPVVNYDHGREYWRAFGFILAWPLFIWNVFTSQPLWWWLAISFAQTFVIIPLIVLRWGKGAYCGWICSCGGLAETLGDTHREKMPHGPVWNRVNMLGQVVLLAALILLVLRIVSWVSPRSGLGLKAAMWFGGLLTSWSALGVQLNYYHVVDILFAGILGVGLYFWFSGRVWCRFACPLAALMHIYTRFTSYRIFADKKKCISCNVCTSVCHQGIDVMNFANKGLPMEDPQCVRCSACVQMCPTGVLSFGRYASGSKIVYDRLTASLVQIRESQKPSA
jgi:NosR/NirI family nitrous oxide reductase transcriptional regulator